MRQTENRSGNIARLPVTQQTRTSSGQIDAANLVVREWVFNRYTGKLTFNFHQGRLNTVVKEQTVKVDE